MALDKISNFLHLVKRLPAVVRRLLYVWARRQLTKKHGAYTATQIHCSMNEFRMRPRGMILAFITALTSNFICHLLCKTAQQQ